MKIHSILIVDDNFEFRKSLSDFLSLGDYEVRTAVDGEEALRIFEQQAFDLVLTDIMMPNKAGFELISDMLRLRPDQRIIAMTGGSRWISHFHLDNARDIGAAQVLTKPFSMKELEEAIAGLEGEQE